MGLILIESDFARLASLFVFLIAALTDLLDGLIAKRRKLQTGFGKFMDPLADKVLVSAALISLVQLGYVKGWMVSIIIFREFIITGFRAIVAYRGVIVPASFWARVKTVMQMVAVILILAFAYAKELSTFESETISVSLEALMYAVTFITVVTGLNYLLEHRNTIKSILK
jgi:CDP-diacylglycerol---glycerol-3-phosphate 3-phosphatidyltransferase